MFSVHITIVTHSIYYRNIKALLQYYTIWKSIKQQMSHYDKITYESRAKNNNNK